MPLAGPPTLRAVETGAGTVRWITDLHPEDARRYRSAVAPVIEHVERSLGTGVMANRFGPGARPIPLDEAARAWGERMTQVRSGSPGQTAMVTDVRRCYRTMKPEAVVSGLRRSGVPRAHRDAIEAFLSDLRHAGIEGLPIGPGPSAALANAVLAVADEAVRGHDVRLLRWVDDVILVGEASVTVRAFDAWAVALAGLGLEPNETKTRRITGLNDGGTLPGPGSTLNRIPRGMIRP